MPAKKMPPAMRKKMEKMMGGAKAGRPKMKASHKGRKAR